MLLSAVLGQKGSDFSETAGLVAVFRGPRLPFIEFCVEARSALGDELEGGFTPPLGSDGPVESFLGSVPVVAAGEASVTPEFGERFFRGLSLLPSLGQVGEGSLVVPLEGRKGVEWPVGRLVDDPGQTEPFGPQRIHSAGATRTS